MDLYWRKVGMEVHLEMVDQVEVLLYRLRNYVKGFGIISAAGGRGLGGGGGGGGGGRISLNCYSKQDDVKVTVHAGLNALFSNGPRRASLARVYALWNAGSISNIGVAFICGIIH